MDSKGKIQQERKQMFSEVVTAFENKYSWLGHQVARELLLSAASWNIEKYSDPRMRYRDHVMLAWNKGWLKTSLLGKMADILGDELCSTIGKVTDAAMRGSTAAGKFTPPKPLKTPFVISTEFGQTEFSDELLNLFLALLEEGETNVALNKIGNISDTQAKKVEEQYDGIEFKDVNEFNLTTNFVFWGATYDPSKLQDDAFRSRMKIVTPEKQLDWRITKCIDKNRFHLSAQTIKDIRNELQKEESFETDFEPPDRLYKEYSISPRESRDMQAYMAARNWWGLDVNPEIMENHIQWLQKSRRIARMDPADRVLDLIFDNAMSYDEIIDETGYSKKEVYKIVNEQLGAKRVVTGKDESNKFIIRSRDGGAEESGSFLNDIDL